MAVVERARERNYENQTFVPEKLERVIDVQNLSVAYQSGQLALEDVSFEINRGDNIALIGPNGAGKSTLIKAVMGLLQPQSGKVVIPGGQRCLGYVPQHEAVDWSFPVTARDAVLMGRTRQIGWLRMPQRFDWQAADDALERVGLIDYADRQVGALSGGQRRRVFIARALAQQAEILLLDEPFSGVDISAQSEILSVLHKLNHEGLTILLSTHDLNLASQSFTKILALKRRLIAYGAAREVYSPSMLAQLYGTRVTAYDGDREVMMFVDEHGCGEGCQ